MQWTPEQQPIIGSRANKLRILAFAGTGKTTTLVGYAQHHPELRILYLCYNSSVELAARSRFPRKNVVSKTAHGLAYAVYGTQYSHKQTKNLRLTDIARALNTQDWELVRDVLSTLNNFMASADGEIDRGHFPRFKGRQMLTTAQERYLVQALGATRSIWVRMKDLQDTSMLIPHDGYLKLYQLSKPDLSQRFDCILLDEAQDVNPVIADIVRIQKIRRVAVGDPHQQLYRFRGAEDALDAPWMEGAETHYLSQSFRFGPAVAHVAGDPRHADPRHQQLGPGDYGAICRSTCSRGPSAEGLSYAPKFPAGAAENFWLWFQPPVAANWIPYSSWSTS